MFRYEYIVLRTDVLVKRRFILNLTEEVFSQKNYSYGYKPDEITVIDTFIEENAPDNVNSGLWYLGKSLELLSDADIVVFAKGWRNARGCRIEFKCAKEYGISYICEE